MLYIHQTEQSNESDEEKRASGSKEIITGEITNMNGKTIKDKQTK